VLISLYVIERGSQPGTTSPICIYCTGFTICTCAPCDTFR